MAELGGGIVKLPVCSALFNRLIIRLLHYIFQSTENRDGKKLTNKFLLPSDSVSVVVVV
jgi:hypothetical protein